jgi:hypothetical protein
MEKWGQDKARVPLRRNGRCYESTKLRVAEIGMNHLFKPINRETLFQAIKAWSNYKRTKTCLIPFLSESFRRFPRMSVKDFSIESILQTIPLGSNSGFSSQ